MQAGDIKGLNAAILEGSEVFNEVNQHMFLSYVSFPRERGQYHVRVEKIVAYTSHTRLVYIPRRVLK